MQGVPHGGKVMPLTIRQMVVQQVQLEAIRRREAVCALPSTHLSVLFMREGSLLAQCMNNQILMLLGYRLQLGPLVWLHTHPWGKIPLAGFAIYFTRVVLLLHSSEHLSLVNVSDFLPEYLDDAGC